VAAEGAFEVESPSNVFVRENFRAIRPESDFFFFADFFFCKKRDKNFGRRNYWRRQEYWAGERVPDPTPMLSAPPRGVDILKSFILVQRLLKNTTAKLFRPFCTFHRSLPVDPLPRGGDAPAAGPTQGTVENLPARRFVETSSPGVVTLQQDGTQA
jgi:hypothetical protein